MSSPIITADETISITDAENLMKEKKIRRLPITDLQGKLIGIVTESMIEKNKKFMMARSLSTGLTHGEVME